MTRGSKKPRFTYHTSIGNHPQPTQAPRYLSSCYSAARGRIQVANSFHTSTQSFPTNDNSRLDEIALYGIEDLEVESELAAERPEELDPKYKAYQEGQEDSDDEGEDENGEDRQGSAKRKRTAGVRRAAKITDRPG